MDKISACVVAKKYIDYLKDNNYKIEKAFLFGSFAKNTNHNDSDIDLALIFDKLENRFNTQVDLIKLTRYFDTRIEPHPFSLDDFQQISPLIYEIKKDGIELN